MNGILQLTCLSCVLLASVPVFADDSPSAAPVQTPKQKMTACLNRQRAANTGMSAQDMKKACSKELQTQENHPSIPASPALVPAKSPP